MYQLRFTKKLKLVAVLLILLLFGFISWKLVARNFTGLSLPSFDSSLKSWIFVLWVVGAVIVIIVSLGVLLLSQSYFIRKRDKKNKPATEEEDGKKKVGAKEPSRFYRFRNWLWEVRNHPLMYMVWVPGAWFAFTGVLWLLQEEMSTWGWPRNNVSAWQWLRWDNVALFWFTPVVALVVTWFVRAEAKPLKFAGWLIVAPLLIVWIVVLSKTTYESDLGETVVTNVSDWKVSENFKTVDPQKPLLYELCWTKPPSVDGIKPKLRADCYNAQIIRNDAFVFEFVMFYWDNYKEQQARFFWDKTADPKKGTWVQTTPKDCPLHGVWFLEADKAGGFTGGVRDQFCEVSEGWVPFRLQKVSQWR